MKKRPLFPQYKTEKYIDENGNIRVKAIPAEQVVVPVDNTAIDWDRHKAGVDKKNW